jgi:nitroreductase/FMN reductase [NAD(P)H]
LPLAEGPAGQAWLKDVPALLIFCGNNRRQRLWHEWRGKPFANDHLDAFFNAAVDAGIALSAFVLAAEAQGLGVCPISVIRNRAAEISELLHLPHHVFPVAGLGVGWPATTPKQSMRLPLDITVHRNGYREDDVRGAIEDYDRRREAAQPFREQRYVDAFGKAAPYGWSEDKARQYAVPERADFGAYVRTRGFNLD